MILSQHRGSQFLLTKLAYGLGQKKKIPSAISPPAGFPIENWNSTRMYWDQEHP